MRMAAWAPMLMRRVKGVLGVVLLFSSSSMAFSSIESELLVDRLARRKTGPAAPVGEVPGRPMAETESRRRWSLIAADVMGPGTGKPVPCDTELLRNRLLKVAEVTEPRRGADRLLSLGLLSEDMMPAASFPATVVRKYGDGCGRVSICL